MNLHDRALLALDRARSLNYRASPAAEHALCLALETMFRTGDSRSFLTSPEVERYVGGNGRNGDRIVRQLLKAGALVEITDPAAVESFRAVVPDTTAPDGARVVTLPDAAIEVPLTSGYAAIEAPTPPQDAAIEASSGRGDAAIEVQSSHISITCVGVSHSYGREAVSPEGYVKAMSPRSVVWNGPNLGSQAARVYGVVASSPHPVTPAYVSSILSIGNRGAKDVLRNLGKVGLIVRADPGPGWIPGTITPSQVSKPSEALKVPQRGSQPQEEKSMPEVACPDCAGEGAVIPGCPVCDVEPAEAIPEPTPARTDLPWGWDGRGQRVTSPDHVGTSRAVRINGSQLDIIDTRTGEVLRSNVGPATIGFPIWRDFQRIINA